MWGRVHVVQDLLDAVRGEDHLKRAAQLVARVDTNAPFACDNKFSWQMKTRLKKHVLHKYCNYNAGGGWGDGHAWLRVGDGEVDHADERHAHNFAGRGDAPKHLQWLLRIDCEKMTFHTSHGWALGSRTRFEPIPAASDSTPAPSVPVPPTFNILHSKSLSTQ
jgi:hypothetical protein